MLTNQNSLEHIAESLEQIAKKLDNLDSLDRSLSLLSSVISDCQVKTCHNSSIAITGTVDRV